MGSVRRAWSVLVAAVIATAGCTDDAPSGIGIGTASRATVNELVEAPAGVRARARVAVAAPAAGTVATIAVHDGDQVRAGQVLVKIDSPAARGALDRAERADADAAAVGRVSVPRADAGLITAAEASARRAFDASRQAALAIPDEALREHALAQVAAAEQDHEAALGSARRAVEQLNAGMASLADLATAVARTQRAQTRAALAAARATVDALTVRAPIAGTVTLGAQGTGTGTSTAAASTLLDQVPAGARDQVESLLGGGASGAAATGPLTVGLPVGAGSPLFTVTDVSTWHVDAEVDETDVPLVHPGVAADVELDALPDQPLTGTVRAVDLQPTTSSRGGVSYTARLDLELPTGTEQVRRLLRPGMSAVARLRVRTAVNTVAVPAAAVFRDESGEAVWLVRDGLAQRRAVRLGAQGSDQVEVTNGLVVGDRVVVAGADRVGAGQRVIP